MTSDKLASPTLSEASAGVISKIIDFTRAILNKKFKKQILSYDNFFFWSSHSTELDKR